MHKYGLQKSETNNQTLPQGVLQQEGQQKKIQYPEQYKNTTVKKL